MIVEKIDLFDYFHVQRKEETKGYLTVIRHEQMPEMPTKTVHPAMLVLPGGGYAIVSQREAEPVAVEYFAKGFDTFVLDYDVAPLGYPVQIKEAAMAMIYIRRNAAAFDILPDKIAAVGFSAGGHLLGCISTLWDDPAVQELFGSECDKVRPDASVYSYAVISSDPAIYHGYTFRNFCKETVNKDDYSIDKKVRPSCSPAFIWANTPDPTVPSPNSVRLYLAYTEAGVPAELHIFRDGGHGLSTCNEETAASLPLSAACTYSRPWIDLSLNFLKTAGFTPVKAEK